MKEYRVSTFTICIMIAMLLAVFGFVGQANAQPSQPKQPEDCSIVSLVDSFMINTPGVSVCEEEFPDVINALKQYGSVEKICVHETVMYKIVAVEQTHYYTLMRDGVPVTCAEIGV